MPASISSLSRTLSRGVVCFALALAVPSPVAAIELAAAPASTSQSAPAHQLLADGRTLSTWLGSHSPDLRAARARTEQAAARARGSRLLPNPVLDGSVANAPLSGTNPAGLGLGHTLIYGVGLSETFELGKRGPRGRAAELRARAARLLVTSTLGERVTLAREALGRAVHSGLRVAILAGSLADAERAAALERTRFEQKALSGVDYDRLLLELANLRADFAREQAEHAAARADCAAALGAECNLSGTGESDLTLPSVLVGNEKSQRAERADLRALELEADAADSDSELAAKRALPDVTVRLGYTYDRFGVSGDNLSTLALSVELPLPVFDHGQHESVEASEHALELTAEKQALAAEARADLSALSSRRAALSSAVDTLEHDTLPRSSGVVTATERAFHEGGASMTDLLLARRNHIALSLRRLDQRFELFEVENELYRVLGANPSPRENEP
jgi:cobalt-zinc-cadmium efflux system outer membrane protein